ncbi:hypothetical protein C8R45DRAFT_1008932 [Mycena sanguinolenta]|nr:hypothetical protein C8R45DRAFT_1008932 [Mycena sanguinolenta]
MKSEAGMIQLVCGLHALPTATCRSLHGSDSGARRNERVTLPMCESCENSKFLRAVKLPSQIMTLEAIVKAQ